MTECYPISSNPLPPRNRKAGSAGVAADTEIGIIDEAGNLRPRGETGEIVVSGPHVTRRYLNDSTNNRNTFANGWFRTGDQGYVDPDGYLFVTGRLKEIINRGGEKISPREIDEVLLEHSAVSEAVTFPVPHPTLGEDIAAAIVLRDNASINERQIQQFALTRLAEFKVPRRIAIVNEIPKGPTGKVQRIGLAEKIGLAAPDPSGSDRRRLIISARNRLEFRLAQIWKEVLGLLYVGVLDNFFELGGHSILAMLLITRVEKEFRRCISLRTLYEAPTIEKLADYLRRGGDTRTWSRLIPLQPRGSKPPFFLLHGEERLGRQIGVDRPVYELRPHGLDGQPAPLTIEEMAVDYLAEIRTVQPITYYSYQEGDHHG
jgi:acyl carrier protein